MDSSEFALQAAVDDFVTGETLEFRFMVMTAAFCMTIYFIVFNLALIQILVIVPINELANMIQSPQDAEKVNRFIINLKRREFDKNFVRNKWIAKQEKAKNRR